MAWKSLLTIATSAERAGIALDAAAKLALAADAHLEVLSLGVDRSQLGYSYIGAETVLLQVALERAAEEAAETEAALKAAFAAQAPDLRWSLDSAVTQLGALNELVAARSRYADLVVLPQPYGDNQGPEAEVALEAAMFEGMAPVLVVPEAGLRSASPKNVVLAWNQSREALVAARRALPLLKAAEHVTITVVDPPAHGPERSDPGGQLCQLLVRHGVKAEVSVLARTMPQISDILARQVRDRDADLLVMGAYGHSRFREAILGGATRDLLERAQVPVFMAH